MNRIFPMMAAAALAACAARGQGTTEPVALTVHADQVVGRVDAGIYGQFLEHIFNSVHGGLWGDLIRNGSLEPHGGSGAWVVTNGVVASTAAITDRRLVFGDPQWGDYELTLEAMKVAGGEGFIVMFRVAGDRRYYWANLGGWGNREHGFEKARGAFGPRVAGQVNAGTWYRVRVRCEGARFRAWLDDALVLDRTDERDPVLKGAVGLTAWDTKVQFRHIKVAALDGKVLFEGLPPHTALASAPAYWTFFGEAEFANDGREPFNSGSALRIRSAAAQGEAGLRQAPLALRQGERYTGSLEARGAAAALRVRVVGGDGRALFTKELGGLGPAWSRQAFEFTAPADADNAALEIVLAGAGDAGVDQVSLFPQSALAAGGFRPDVLKAIADLKPATIRYPGGCFASAYRWKDGIGPREKRAYYPNVIWDDQDPNQMGTDEFMDLCRRVGAAPILALNTGCGVEEALDWLEYCNGAAGTRWGAARAQNGHPEPYGVRLWEIDNETWGMGPERYAGVVTTFSRALRAKDPSVKIIACGGYGYDDGKGSSNGWNKKLLDACAKDFDLLSIHYYNGICYGQDFMDDPRRYEAYIRDAIGGLIQASANPAIRVYCSEWGMMNDEWRSGLYTGGLLNGFERLGERLPMSCPAVWLQSVSRERPRPRWASCLILFDHAQTYGAPTWVVEKLWREHFAPKLLKLDGPERPLNAVATGSEDGKTVFLKTVNPTKAAVSVALTVAPGFRARSAALQLVSPGAADARNTLDEPTRVQAQPGEARLADGVVRFTLPPLSAGAVTLTE